MTETKTIVAQTRFGRNIVATQDGFFEVQPYGDNHWITVPTLAEAQAAAAPPRPADAKRRAAELVDLIEEDIAAAQEAECAMYKADMLRRVRPMLRELRSLIR